MSSTQTEKRVHISDLHSDHSLWRNALDFYKDEISILEHRIEEIVKRNNAPEVMAELEHFQNQFIRQRELVDEMSHELNVHEDALAKEAKDHPIAVDHRLFADHGHHREAMSTFETIYRALKTEFMAWLSKRM
ncbi:MAG: hypothetical protein ABI599_14675 [Flavobacteriales bacterium]